MKPYISKLYNELRTTKFKHIINLKNFIFLHDHTNKNMADIFKSYFSEKKQQHYHDTRGRKGPKNVLLNIPIKIHQGMDQIPLHLHQFLVGAT